jgi:tetratricopeptide (TPR) repeat protein
LILKGWIAQEIYAVMEELSQLNSICLCITSRISTIPADCETFDIPTLSIEAARDAFHRIHKNSERPDLVDNVLEQLGFHPLSITLLATVAHHNKWGTARLVGEWERRRTGVLQTEHNKSLAATIELSLSSAMFQELGADARELLGVVAFFPQGVDENNVDWLFPTIPNRANVFDKFCILSLTYRINGSITMLAPLRDYLSPKDPKSSSLLCATRERYFTRMSVDIDPDGPNFGETQWITSEDVNVEHLLDVFTTIDADSDGVWDACAYFMNHLYWHKARPTILGSKIEGLPDDHRSKSTCLIELSWLFESVGNLVESKRLLMHVLKLRREQGDDWEVARVLKDLSGTNRQMNLPEEGIQQAKEALEIYKRLGDIAQQADCLIRLSQLLVSDKRFDAAEVAAFRAIDLLPEEGEQFRVCKSHRALASIYQSKGEIDKAVRHYELVLGIASPFNWHDNLFWAHYNLAQLFHNEGRLDDAQTHIERAKSYTANHAYNRGCAMEQQAKIWYDRHALEEARSEALRAVDVYEKLGAAKNVEDCRELLRKVEKELNGPVALDQLGFDCKLLHTTTARIDFSFEAQETE